MMPLTEVLLTEGAQLEVRGLTLGGAGRGGELLLGVRGRGEAPGYGRVTPWLLGAGARLAPTGLIHTEAHYHITCLKQGTGQTQVNMLTCCLFVCLHIGLYKEFGL